MTINVTPQLVAICIEILIAIVLFTLYIVSCFKRSQFIRTKDYYNSTAVFDSSDFVFFSKWWGPYWLVGSITLFVTTIGLLIVWLRRLESGFWI